MDNGPVPMEVGAIERGSSEKGKRKKRDLSKVKCYGCGEYVHYKHNCAKEARESKNCRIDC